MKDKLLKANEAESHGDHFIACTVLESEFQEYGDMTDAFWGDNFKPRLISYPVETWLCTDTIVGMNSIFLDDEWVGYSMQTGRKCDRFFYWKDKESLKKVKEYCLSLLDEEEWNFELAIEGQIAEDFKKLEYYTGKKYE